MSAATRTSTAPAPAALQVEQVEAAELFVDDGVGARRSRLDVEAVVLHDARHLLRRRVVGVERDGAVAVRQEEHRPVAASPHRVEVVRVGARHALDGRVGESRDPDGRRLAAAVALPDVEGPRDGHVGDARAVGRHRALVAHRQRQRLREARRRRPSVNSRLNRPFSLMRDDENRTRLPSGVHPVTMSAPGWYVRRRGTPPVAGTV